MTKQHNLQPTPAQLATLPDGFVMVEMEVQPTAVVQGCPGIRKRVSFGSSWRAIPQPFQPGDELVVEQRIVCGISASGTKVVQCKRTVTTVTPVETDGVWAWRVEIERNER